MTRLRPPAVPSVAPLVLGVCAAIAALIVIFVAIAAYTFSSRTADAATSVVWRQVALVVTVFSLVPGAATAFFVRYARTRRTFNLAVQRFQDERNQATTVRFGAPGQN